MLPCASPEEEMAVCGACLCLKCEDHDDTKCLRCMCPEGTTFLCVGGV